jgi:hypothetical protein
MLQIFQRTPISISHTCEISLHINPKKTAQKSSLPPFGGRELLQELFFNSFLEGIPGILLQNPDLYRWYSRCPMSWVPSGVL